LSYKLFDNQPRMKICPGLPYIIAMIDYKLSLRFVRKSLRRVVALSATQRRPFGKHCISSRHNLPTCATLIGYEDTPRCFEPAPKTRLGIHRRSSRR